MPSDARGSCAWMPDMCTANWAPVCGCDGRTYSKGCAARAAGVSVSLGGQCDEESPYIA